MVDGDPVARGWVAGVALYSGRPDPSWPLGEAATQLVRRFDELEPWEGRVPSESRLGYRGAWLRSPDGRRWRAFAGVAWREGAADVRRDDERGFERSILASAPPGVLPSDFPDLE